MGNTVIIHGMLNHVHDGKSVERIVSVPLVPLPLACVVPGDAVDHNLVVSAQYVMSGIVSPVAILVELCIRSIRRTIHVVSREWLDR